MAKIKGERCRLSIDVHPEEHRRIKMSAVMHNQTIRSYVFEAIKERLGQDLDQQGLLVMSAQLDPVLAELWDNEKDAAYEKL